MSDNGVYQRLAERFAPEAHRVKDIGSAKLTYVDGETVISRLNEVLGVDGWSFEVKDIHILENEVWALGRLTAVIDGKTVVREQVGGQIINRKRLGEIIELSNDIKGAITDCAKKCATLVGIGLYLYDPSERREVEQEMREAKRAPRPIETAPSKPRKANVEGCMVGWNTAVKRTRFDDPETASKYVAYYTKDAHKTLESFFNSATEDEATAFLRAINDRIAKEAREAAAS